MGWVKLDDGFFRHPKALAAGSDARLLAVVAMCWAGQYMTDGRVPANALPALAFDAGLSVDDAQAASDRLVEVRLWERQADGWTIHGWDDWQRTREVREEKQQANRDRQRRWRERKIAERKALEDPDVTRNERVSHTSITRLEAEAEAEAEADKDLSLGFAPFSSSSSVGGLGETDDDDDDRIRKITDQIGQRRASRTPPRSSPSGLLRTSKASALAECGEDVARLLKAGQTPAQIVEQLDPGPRASRSAAAARARLNGAT